MKNSGRRRGAVTAVMAVTALAFTTACDSGSAGDSGAPTLSIAFSVSTLNNPFFVQLRDGAEQAAKEMGVKLVVQDAQNDATKQINDVQAFVTQKVQAILVNAVETDQSEPIAKAAAGARIPLVAVDRSIDGTVVSEITSDNVQGGQLAAEALAKAVGPGDVVTLQGISGTSASRDRDEGFTQGMALRSSIRVVSKKGAEFDRAKGMDVMSALAQSQPKLKGVFAENDEMALGAVKALGSRAGKDVMVVGFDGTPDALVAVQNGTLAATIAQQPRELGRLAVEQAVKTIRKEKVRQLIEVPVKVVTKDNVADFRN
ncbi:substrate-binding domain-containing protein [Allokutzneria sp. NRRL B-24872]|uniref:substrate-binding domain-containing protein n=1 Tax=Allokutzneria sp. NRRL B-24872 TaxID=1137961 RepID=UPI000A3BC28B|nr:substrate-binding domain-containing protein [Allokutzneria sp. NRRL B-24872]